VASCEERAAASRRAVVVAAGGGDNELGAVACEWKYRRGWVQAAARAYTYSANLRRPRSGRHKLTVTYIGPYQPL
jgi:hypothetical protein